MLVCGQVNKIKVTVLEISFQTLTLHVVDWKLKLKNVEVIVIEKGGGGNSSNKYWPKKPPKQRLS